MAQERKTAEPPTHPAAKEQIADGAMIQIRQLHARTVALAATVEQSRPLSKRISRGITRARRNGWRLHRYPRDYWRGLRATGTTKAAAADAATLTALTENGQYDEALAFAAALLPVKARDAEFLDLARHAFAKAGALSLQARAATALRLLEDTSARRTQERNVLGRITETSATWLPRVPEIAPPAPVDGRVLHLLKAAMPYRQSGYTMRSLYTVDSQRTAGMDPVVITALGFPQQVGIADPPATSELNGTTYHHLEPAPKALLKGAPDLFLDAYAEAAAVRVAQIAPSVIHAHSGHRGYEGALVGLALARAFGLPFVYEVRGFFESLWSREQPWNERGELYERRMAVEKRCMNEADAVVTLSQSMRAEIVSRGVDPAKVHVVPNGVDVEAFRPVPRSAELLAELGLTGRFLFGYVSNLDHWREGHETLIRAAALLRARGVPAVALIVGDGGRRAELEQLAADEKAGDAVLFTGRVPHDRVLDYYRLLDVFVVPRLPERAARLVTPLKPFEAMAAEIPVVVSALEPLLEITGDGERGRSFPPGDAEALADVLAQLQKDPDERADLARRGRDWVIADRQWSSSAARYAAIYDAIRDRARN